MSAVTPETADKLHTIRSRLAAAGAEMKPGTDMLQIRKVLEHVGDVDLSIDAILMDPRPGWLVMLIGLDLWVPPSKRAPKLPAPPVWQSGPELGAQQYESD